MEITATINWSQINVKNPKFSIFFTIAIAILAALFLWPSRPTLLHVAEKELVSGATIIRIFDDEATKDPEKVWRLSFPDEKFKQLVSRYYYACDESDSSFIKRLVGQKDSEFQAQRSTEVFRNSSRMNSKYVFQYGTNEMYLIVLYK